MSVREHAQFEAFVDSHAGPLYRIAFLLCADREEAQDLVQCALERIFAAWGRAQKADNPQAYARAVLVRVFLSRRRRARVSEQPLGEIAMPASPACADLELRLTLLTALRRLPPRNRSVVVLRYLEDHSIETVAEMLEATPAAVKSLNTRSLAMLRDALAEDRANLFHP